MDPERQHDEIVVLDFGSQYSHLIVRRIRELNVYCEMHSCEVGADVLRGKPNLRGLVLSGGPASVYAPESPHVKAEVWEFAREKGVPILGICYGLQEIAFAHGGEVAAGERHEYGLARVHKLEAEEGPTDPAHGLLNGLTADEEGFQVWMSHADKLRSLPDGFITVASTGSSEFAIIAHPAQRIFGLQFHPEVTHTPQGPQLLRNFVVRIAGCRADWSMGSFQEEAVRIIRERVGDSAHVIGAVSGGVDSTVASALMKRAIGDRFHAVLVDNGVMREGEVEQVVCSLRDGLGINLRVVDASELFLSRLEGVTDPERKRKAIGHAFVEVFEETAAALDPPPEFLLQGTLYPDVIESVSYKGPSALIKTHHNVGGLKEKMHLKLVEPLRELFKDEVRALGLQMGVPEPLIHRHPFPGPGLAIRVLGAITPEALRILRHADRVYLEELHAAGVYRDIAQAFAVLLPVRSVGVMGDCRTYEQVVALRAVQSLDYMTADWYHMPYKLLARISSRIINEVRGVSRVVYDVSSKPPSTIEWE